MYDGNIYLQDCIQEPGERARSIREYEEDCDREMIGDDVEYGLEDIGCK